MSIKEIVVISGKGGTGKTTLAASIAPYLQSVVIADCDVDAPDLHILLQPEIQASEEFSGCQKAYINENICNNCGLCTQYCRFDAVPSPPIVLYMKCEGCGVCEYICPQKAITMKDAATGTVFHSQTMYGPMKHARLVPGEETSGKLVTKVRNDAKVCAEEMGLNVILIDGSPGVGCNVISSITGADTVIIVTEPTKSGLHDLQRVLDICERFSNKVIVVINKHDISPVMTERIEEYCGRIGIPISLKIPFSKKIVEAISDKKIPSLKEKNFFSKIGWTSFIESL